MRRFRGLVVLAAAMLGGCLDNTIVLHVAADGHGRAVITSRIYEAGLRAFDGLVGSPPPSSPTPIDQELRVPTESELEHDFGTRVKLASTTFEKTNDGGVRTTVIEFDDVTKLKTGFPPVMSVAPGTSVGIEGLESEPLMTFAIKRHDNGDRLLVLTLPDGRIDARPDPTMTVFPTNSPEELALKRAIKKMAVRFYVELDDVALLRTNAPKVNGNRATILDLDLDRLVNDLDEAKVRRAMTLGSVQELLWQLGDMPGAVVPTEHEVFLEFEAPQAAAPPIATPAPPPDTEIYLAPLKIAGGTIEVGAAIDISNSPGYDNQPSFTPDGKTILFTSLRGQGVTQTDIYKYDIASRAISRFTNTPEAEYSPTMMPDGEHMSAIRVEADGTQRLWSIVPSGPKIQLDLILPGVKPVGYHAWSDARTVALFVLGPPATLQLADTQSGTTRIIATDIGRSIQRIPGGSGPAAISFVQREATPAGVRLVIKRLDPATGAVSVLTPAVEGSTEADTAWTPDGTLLMAHEGTLYAWRPGQSGWKAIADLQRLSLKGVTRLAVSPKGDYLALVVGSPR